MAVFLIMKLFYEFAIIELKKKTIRSNASCANVFFLYSLILSMIQVFVGSFSGAK